jgi:hypothetical protein
LAFSYQVSNFGSQFFFNKPGSKQYLLVQKISALFKMPRTSKKAKQAKKQWQNAGNKFGPATENTDLSTDGSTYITSESLDELSSYKLSSGELSSDESVSATCKLYSKKLPSYISLHILISKDEAVIDHTSDCQEEKACSIYWGLSSQQVPLPELLEESSNRLCNNYFILPQLTADATTILSNGNR